jgi:hypothetical protein
MVADTTYKAEGQFHIKVLLNGSEAEDMQKIVDTAHSEWKKKCQQKSAKKWQEYMPYKVSLDEEGMEEGTEFHFKLKASGTNGRTGETFTQRPVVVGPKNEPILGSIKVGNGSIGRVAYEVAPYEHGTSLGVQLRLRMVQVLKLVEYVPSGNADDVFDVEEDYEVVQEEPTSVKIEEGEAFETDEEDKSGDF